MELTLTEDRIAKCRKLLGVYEQHPDDVTYAGVLAGAKQTLEALGIFEAVLQEQELTFSVEQSVIDELISKLEWNKIEALWNRGVASGIAWVLNGFGLYEIEYAKTMTKDGSV